MVTIVRVSKCQKGAYRPNEMPSAIVCRELQIELKEEWETPPVSAMVLVKGPSDLYSFCRSVIFLFFIFSFVNRAQDLLDKGIATFSFH